MGRWKALIVDDSATFRQVFVKALSKIPELTCIQAADGAEGIRCLVIDHVDLIITDLQMPVMNGFAFISYLRHREDTRHVPIVVVTSAGTESDQQKLEAAGIRAFLRKPVAPDCIVACAIALIPQSTGPLP